MEIEYSQTNYQTILRILGRMIREAGMFYKMELEGPGEIKLLIRANLKSSRRFLSLPDKCQHNTHHHIDPR